MIHYDELGNRINDNQMGDNIDQYLYDTADEIQKCLSCTKKECTNCLAYKDGKWV